MVVFLLAVFLMISLIYLFLGYMAWMDYGRYCFTKVSLPWFRTWALSVIFLWPVVLLFGTCFWFFKEIEEIWSGKDRQ